MHRHTNQCSVTHSGFISDSILGAVTGLKNVLHPIAVARLVMENTPHVLLSGDGVQEFAQKHNIPLEESLHTKSAWDALEEFKKNKMVPTKMEIG